MNDPQGLHLRLQTEIKAAHDRVRTPLTPEEVAAIVSQVVQSLTGDVSATDLKFYTELETLTRYIQQAKHDIASIRPADISTDHIPSATNELDAVVGATEDATNRIMDICDEISALAKQCPPDLSSKLVDCTTRVFEACNFQDITGQRITKVVETLKHIDGRIEAIVKAMGDEMQRHGGEASKPAAPDDDEKALLNGPQLPGNAISQDEIDRLMSGK